MNFLAGDIGGTKTLLAIYNWNGTLIKLHQHRYSSKEWDSIEPMINHFLGNLPRDIKAPKKGCLAIAGPVTNGSCKLTNLNWELEQSQICKSAKLDSLELINDVCVLLYGIPLFSKDQFIYLQKGKYENNIYKQVAIIAAGTGLGVGRGLIKNDQIVALPSEGGHQEFSPRSKTEWELSEWLKSDLNLKRLSLERIVSGTGLGNVARWMLLKPEVTSHPLKRIAEEWRSQNHDLPALASKAAQRGDSLMKEAQLIWLSAYGSAAGDLALQELCQGGLWIAGGTAGKQLEGLRSTNFLDSMKNKGRFTNYMEDLPVMVVVDPEAGLFSAACRAHMLAKSDEKIN